MRRILVLILGVLALTATRARAQSATAIAVGLTITTDDPTGSLGLSSTSIGPVLRINTGPGIGPAIGFDWYAVGVRAMAAGQSVYVGELRVRPVMGGLAYNWKRGKWWVSGSVVGGYAFTRLTTINDGSRPAFRASLGASGVTIDTTNSLVWRPQLGVWYDASSRVGITASIAYMGVRPSLSLSSDRGLYRTPLDASSTVLTFGLVYGIF